MATIALYSLISKDFLLIWFSIEINNFIFISYLTLFINSKKMSFIYLFVQILASSSLLIGVIINYINIYTRFVNYLIFSSVCLKLGIPPFHYWFITISTYIEWSTIFIFFTIQKIIPLIVISYIQPPSTLTVVFVLLAILVPPLIIINLSNFKKILAYSSVNQSGWIIIIISFMPSLWFIYFILYALSLKLTTDLITIKKIMFNIIIKSNIPFKILVIRLSINLSRMPPFIFFTIKWYGIFLFITDLKINVLIIIILLRSLIIIYVYLTMIIKTTLTNFTYSKTLILLYYKNKYIKAKIWLIILIINLSLILPLI